MTIINDGIRGSITTFSGLLIFSIRDVRNVVSGIRRTCPSESSGQLRSWLAALSKSLVRAFAGKRPPRWDRHLAWFIAEVGRLSELGSSTRVILENDHATENTLVPGRSSGRSARRCPLVTLARASGDGRALVRRSEVRPWISGPDVLPGAALDAAGAVPGREVSAQHLGIGLHRPRGCDPASRRHTSSRIRSRDSRFWLTSPRWLCLWGDGRHSDGRGPRSCS